MPNIDGKPYKSSFDGFFNAQEKEILGNKIYRLVDEIENKDKTIASLRKQLKKSKERIKEFEYKFIDKDTVFKNVRQSRTGK